MLAEKFDDCRQICLPVVRPSFKIHEHGGDAGLDEQGDCVLEVFVKIGIEDALIHEMQSRSDIE